jgi:hypothetical protein
MNQKLPIQSSHLSLLIQTPAFSSNQHVSAYWVQWLGYMLEDLEFKSLQKQENYLISKIFRPAPAPTHPASNSSFFSGSKVASADSLTTHICLEPSLKISGAIPPLNLSASMGQPNFTLTFSSLMTYIYIYIYMSYRTANLQTLHFIYLFNKPFLVPILFTF